tara:strand:- start:44 stop:292 length:249 start_codon:yes stop_codon:yes gene_type:complete
MFGRIAKIVTAPGRMAAKAIAGSAKAQGSLGGQSKPEGPIDEASLAAFQKSAGLTKDKDGAKKFLGKYIFGKGRKERRDPTA